MFFIAVSMSLFFGFISQTLLTKMGIVFAILGICVFVFVSVAFDMVGIAVASADIDVFKKWADSKIKGARVGLKFCSTLCGAGGACIVVALTGHVENANLIMLTSISTSALSAGLTIFFKALMKERALKNSNKIILKLGIFLEKTIFKEKTKNM